MTSLVKSSVNRSRTTLRVRSGSPYRSCGALALDLGLDVLPAGLEPLDVAGQLVLAGALGRGPHDDAGGVRDDLLEERLEAVALGVGQLAGDAAGGAVRHVDQEPAGQADLAGQPGALVPDRVLRDLHQDGLAGGQHRLDLAGLAVLVAERGPVDLTGVEDRVAALADVDERRLHGGQHVLDPAEVDVADQRGLGRAGHVVLDEDLVLEDADLGQVLALAHDHHPVDGLAAGQELGLADDRGAAATGLAALAAALLLGLQAGGALDRGDLVLGGALAADPGDGVGGVVPALSPTVVAGAAAAAPAAGRRAVARAVLALGSGLGAGVVRALVGLVGVLGVALGARVAGLAAAAAATATAATGRAVAVARLVVALGGLVLVGGLGRLGGLVLVLVGGLVGLGRLPAAGAAALLAARGLLLRGLLALRGVVDLGRRRRLGVGGLGRLDGLDRLCGRRCRGLARTAGRGLLRDRRLEQHRGGRGLLGRSLRRRLGGRLGAPQRAPRPPRRSSSRSSWLRPSWRGRASRPSWQAARRRRGRAGRPRPARRPARRSAPGQPPSSSRWSSWLLPSWQAPSWRPPSWLRPVFTAACPLPVRWWWIPRPGGRRPCCALLAPCDSHWAVRRHPPEYPGRATQSLRVAATPSAGASPGSTVRRLPRSLVRAR